MTRDGFAAACRDAPAPEAMIANGGQVGPVSDTAEPGAFHAMLTALEAASQEIIGAAEPRLLVIPIHGESKNVIGGLWGFSLFRWMRLDMLFVPPSMRNAGVGSALVALAEAEARNRGCLGMQVDTLSFQAVGFYEKSGFSRFGMLEDCPPGHQRLFFQKRLAGPSPKPPTVPEHQHVALATRHE